MEPLELSSYKIAKAIGVSIPTVNEIVRERRAITAQMAMRLSRYFGTSPQYWLSLQAEYDLRVARERLGNKTVKGIIPLSRRERALLQF
jgi:addiction module HigA family antidote